MERLAYGSWLYVPYSRFALFVLTSRLLPLGWLNPLSLQSVQDSMLLITQEITQYRLYLNRKILLTCASLRSLCVYWPQKFFDHITCRYDLQNLRAANLKGSMRFTPNKSSELSYRRITFFVRLFYYLQKTILDNSEFRYYIKLPVRKNM